MSRFNYTNSSFDKDGSDVSEADPLDIAKILKDTDEMDGDLFKGMTKSSSISNFSKTMPAPASNKPASIVQRNKNFTFDDDPLQDIDSLIGKAKSNVKQNQQSSPSKQASINQPAQNSFQLFSTMPANSAAKPNKPKNNFFDDIDSSELNFERGNQRSKNPQLKTSEGTAPSSTPAGGISNKSKSLVDDLFGKSKETSTANENNEFKLNEKYLNMSQQSAKNNDEEFTFGGYVPSAIATSSSTAAPRGMRRNVSFTDDFFGSEGLSATTRPKTTSSINLNSNKQDEPNLMKTMPNLSKNTSDWLGLSNSSNEVQKPNSNRRTSDFNSLDELLKPRDSVAKASSVSNKEVTSKQASSDLDWLGIKDTSRNSNDKDSSFELNENKQLSSTNKQQRPSIAQTTSSIEQLLHEKPPIPSSNAKLSSILDQPVVKPSTHTNTKDSMNSSFADSIENTDRPQINPASILNGINNINPLQFINDTGKQQQKENEFNLIATSEGEDGWLNNLITNKKGVKKLPINATNVNYDSTEIQAMLQKLKQLEYENQDLHMQLQHNKAHYELQIQLTQESCENRLRMIKEDRENSLRLFKEEKEILQNHIDLVEKEKHEMASVYKKKTEDIQKDCDLEIEKLRSIQKNAIETLKTDHESVLKRIKHLKETELDAAMAATAHSRTIESVLTLIEDNTKNLDSISQKVKMGHMVNLNEQEIQIRNKEESLKLQEDRLLKKQKEYENEIGYLNQTIQRLENHLAEQSKSVAEERWKGKQQEKKLEAFQDALLNEQRIVMDKLARERNDIDRSKDEILMEQKRLMQQIYEEKRKNAEDRAQIESAIAAYKDKQHKDSLNNINIEAEITVSTRRLNEEKTRLEQLGKDIREKEFQLKQERTQLEEKKQEVDMKAAKLEQIALQLNQKKSQAEELYAKSNREKDAQMKIFEQVNSIKASHDSRLNQIQQQLMSLNEREAFLNQEKVALYKQRQELELYKSNIKCSKCKDPVKDFGLIGLSTPSTLGYGTMMQSSLLNSQNFVRYQSPLYNLNQTNNLDDAKLMRQLKSQILKDKQFIHEEKQFINTLRSESLTSKSFSMNQLNSISAS